MLRCCLVCGIKHEHIQQHLLNEGDSLTLQQVLDIAHSMESAIHQASMMRSAYSRNPEKFEGVLKINASTQVKNVIGVIEDANQMIVHLNHRNAMFVRNDILQKLCRSKCFRNNRETKLVREEEKEDLDADSTK